MRYAFFANITNCPAANISQCKTSPWGFVASLSGPIFLVYALIGLVGNSLVIAVTARNKTTSTGLLLMTLSAMDILYVVTFAIFLPPIILSEYNTSNFIFFLAGQALREIGIFESLFKFFKSVSVWTIVLITAERFTVVMNPLNASSINVKSTALRIGFVFVCNVVFWSIRKFVWFKKHSCIACVGLYIIEVQRAANDPEFPLIWVDYIHGRSVQFITMMDFAIPMSILLVLNSMIIVTLAKARYQRQQMTSQSQSSNDETKMLMALIFVFVLLEAPRAGLVLPTVDLASSTADIVQLLGTINSSVNFFIYAWYGKKFRADLRKLLGFKLG